MGRVLVTGAQGFVGSHLVRDLGADGPSGLDLFRPETIAHALQEASYDCVVHLAAISHVPTCERDPELAFRTNREGTRALLEAMREHAPRAHLVFASTAQVYAAPTPAECAGEAVFDENREIAPQNVYAQSKREAELLIAEAAKAWGLRATVLRLFNHSHKSQSTEFFLPHIHSQLRSGATLIPVGNLEIRRDLGAIQDLVAAIRSVIGLPGGRTFNLCSGQARHLGHLAEALASAIGVRAKFVRDEARVRSGEPRSIRGSHALLTEATGWKPKAVSDAEFLRFFLEDY